MKSSSNYSEFMSEKDIEKLSQSGCHTMQIEGLDEWIDKQIQLGTDADGGVIFRDAETGNHYSVKKIDIEDLPF